MLIADWCGWVERPHSSSPIIVHADITIVVVARISLPVNNESGGSLVPRVGIKTAAHACSLLAARHTLRRIPGTGKNIIRDATGFKRARTSILLYEYTSPASTRAGYPRGRK